MQQAKLYENREVEGIVVRCKRDGKDFFFKIKNEHYLIFREYREVTKAVLKDKKPRATYEKTKYYIQWLKKRIHDHPEWFEDYARNKNIIEVRQRFEKIWESGHLNLGGDPAENE